MPRLVQIKMATLAFGVAAAPLLAQTDGAPDPAAVMLSLLERSGAARSALEAADPSGPTFVSIDFAYDMPHEVFAAAMEGSAPVVAEMPGLIWKVWSDDPAAGLATGSYLFASRDAARFYLDHVFPAGPPSKEGVSDVEIRVMEVMEGPSAATRAPLG